MNYLENLIPVKITESNTIVVTSNDIKHQILRYRLDHQIIDNLKIMTDQEFEQMFCFSSNPELLVYLINHNPWASGKLKVDVAKQLEVAVHLIAWQEMSEHPLYEYVCQLVAKGLVQAAPPLPNYSFVFYLPRLSDLILGVTAVDYPLATKQSYLINEYNYYLDEIEAVIEQIAKLIDNGLSFEQIHLIAPSDYHQLINQVASSYRLPIKGENKLPLLAHADGLRVLEQLKQGVEVELETVEPLLIEAVIEIVNNYAKFERSAVIDLIIADFENQTVTLNKSDGLEIKGRIDSRYTQQNFKNDYFFILGNYQDGLVSYELDTNIVEDQYRTKLLTTDAHNKIEDSLLYNILNNAQNLFVSYAKKLLDKEVTLANNLSGCERASHGQLLTSEFSQASDQLRFARANYIRETFNQKTAVYDSLNNHYKIDYADNQFTSINREYDSLKLSYTSINDYYKCGYRFYLGHVLRIKNGKFDSRKVLIGNIVHFVLENIESFSDLTSASIKTIIAGYARENNIEVTVLEQLYFDKFSTYLEAVCVYMKQEELNSGFTNIDREMSFEMELASNVTLVGKIDKVLSKIEGDNLFVEIYDYKTGSLNIDISGVEYGLNMQNLIYFLLIQDYYKNEVGEEVLAGTYQHQIKQKLLYDDQELLDTMKIKGYSKLKHDNVFKRTEKIISEQEIEELTTKVADKVAGAATAITNNQFPINPKIIKGKNESCGFCPYASICNKSINDYQFLN